MRLGPHRRAGLARGGRRGQRCQGRAGRAGSPHSQLIWPTSPLLLLRLCECVEARSSRPSRAPRRCHGAEGPPRQPRRREGRRLRQGQAGEEAKEPSSPPGDSLSWRLGLAPGPSLSNARFPPSSSPLPFCQKGVLIPISQVDPWESLAGQARVNQMPVDIKAPFWQNPYAST